MKGRSDRNRGQKIVEREFLDIFVKAYNNSKSINVSINDSTIIESERPDFIAKKNNGLDIGIELVQIVRPPEIEFVDRVFRNREYMDIYNAIELVMHHIEEKENKRQDSDWQLQNSNILVLQLIDCPIHLLYLDDLKNISDKSGFREIFLADCTMLEEYNEVELFCLAPTEMWGYQYRINPSKKPYFH
ncbi:MAG: hypothetical protein JW984_04850 [Deltaproteobacteria bacterium]|uniref:Uncharacterized protein n=1 Tax=Candidatus Zymogenus saltonus TaxID=2844893 RepID=A0A9D8PMQ9_9DELT|nr:hypothetical protein [Candidatus Zymogenus saltonus]